MELHDEFNCPVCKVVIYNAVTFDCFHTFCRNCINLKIAKHNPYVCDICQNIHLDDINHFACPLCAIDIQYAVNAGDGIRQAEINIDSFTNQLENGDKIYSSSDKEHYVDNNYFRYNKNKIVNIYSSSDEEDNSDNSSSSDEEDNSDNSSSSDEEDNSDNSSSSDEEDSSDNSYSCSDEEDKIDIHSSSDEVENTDIYYSNDKEDNFISCSFSDVEDNKVIVNNGVPLPMTTSPLRITIYGQ